MKKLYTLMLAAATASMMFAEAPIMQRQVFINTATPHQVQIEKSDLANSYEKFKSAAQYKAKNNAVRFNAPSRASNGLTRDELCKLDFVQNYMSYLVYALSQGEDQIEFCGDLYLTPGEGENEVLMTGLYGQQEAFAGSDITVKGTFDPETQKLSFPFDQVVIPGVRDAVYFSGFGWNPMTNEEVDFTEKDALVLCVENFGGQYVITCEGYTDGTMEVIPYFGFEIRDRKGENQGWYDIAVGQMFYIFQASVNISYQYLVDNEANPDGFDVYEYAGKGIISITPLAPGDDNSIQIGPFTNFGFGCPVMFVNDNNEKYFADETYTVIFNNGQSAEYKNPVFMIPDNESSLYFYLSEFIEFNGSLHEEPGVFLAVNVSEEGYFETADFDCMLWTGVDVANDAWLGYRLPAHVEAIEFEEAGISDIMADQVKDNRWFNLQGIQVNKDMLQKGNIYINNGKKVLVK